MNTLLRQRGTTRQLSSVIIVCLFSALFLLPAIIWFPLHFNGKQAPLSSLESAGLLAYVTFCGWLLPIGATLVYYVFAQPRAATQSSSQAQLNKLNPPRYQPGVESPFVFSNDRPWGWLEYRNGNFQGQRLALKRVVATLGRDENCDIWLDDDMASRYHAELAWDAGRVCLTDNSSLNGLRLNGRPVHGNVQVASNDVIEIGSHQFAILLVDNNVAQIEQDDDPLLKHTWRSALDLQSKVMPIAHTGQANLSVQPVRVPETQGYEPTRPDQVGNQLEYAQPQANPLAPVLSPFTRQAGGPAPLRLPSRPVDQ